MAGGDTGRSPAVGRGGAPGIPVPTGTSPRAPPHPVPFAPCPGNGGGPRARSLNKSRPLPVPVAPAAPGHGAPPQAGRDPALLRGLRAEAGTAGQGGLAPPQSPPKPSINGTTPPVPGHPPPGAEGSPPSPQAYRRVWAGLRGPLLAFYAEPRDRQVRAGPSGGSGGGPHPPSGTSTGTQLGAVGWVRGDGGGITAGWDPQGGTPGLGRVGLGTQGGCFFLGGGAHQDGTPKGAPPGWESWDWNPRRVFGGGHTPIRDPQGGPPGLGPTVGEP